jgi:hypothetical protein
MKRILVLLLILVAGQGSAVPLTAYQNLTPAQKSQIGDFGLFLKGTADTNWYAIEVDPATGALPVTITGTIPVSGTVTANQGTAGASAWPVSVATLPLPTGAATSALQTTGNSSLSSIDGKLGTLGQKTMAGSAPVVIASDQSAIPISGSVTATNASIGATGAATPASATLIGGTDGANLQAAHISAAGLVSVDGSGVTQPVSGTVAVSNFPATQPVSGTVAATQSGTWTVQPGNTANTTAWKVDGSAVTQPVSGTVSANASQTGTWTVQPGNTANTTPWLSTISQGGNSATVSAGGALKVDGSASTQPVSGTVTANQGGAPWTVTGTGTAGTAAAGVVTVQGIASMTALKVDGSAVTQPVSGTVAVSNLPTTADTNAGAASSSTLRVVGAGRSLTTTLATYDYTGGTVTTAAYTQVTASTANAITRLYVFDSSGSAIIIATGAAAAEVDRIYLPPGGNSTPYEVTIPASTRISIKALDTSASTGRLIITGLQ